MFFEILNYVYFIILYFIMTVMLLYFYLSYLQIDGYNFKKFFKNISINFLLKPTSIILLILIVFELVYSSKMSEVIAFVNTLIIGCVFIILLSRFFDYVRLVFTRRVFRYIGLILLLSITQLVFCIFYHDVKFFGLTLTTIVILNLIFVVISHLLLIPIEKMVAKYYINKAKKILKDNKLLRVVGITGSYGKTTVKEILISILKQQYNVVATPESFNTPMGISKTINQNVNNLTEVFICEMGAKKVGEINEICEIVSPTCGIITAVGEQHTETFGTIDNIYKTKKELPDYLHNSKCVFNLMNTYSFRMYNDYIGNKIGVFVVNGVHKVSGTKCIKKIIFLVAIKKDVILNVLYSFPKNNNYYAKSIKMTEYGSGFKLYYSKKYIGDISISLLGIHNVINTLLAISMSMDMGVSYIKVQAGLSLLRPIRARMEKFVSDKGAIILNNGYNSNINSAKSSLKVLSLFDKRKKLIITPGLVETSDDVTYNRKFGEIVGSVADEVIIVKAKNKNAILSGLSNVCFDMSNVYFVSKFSETRGLIDMLGSDYVVLIENDLPDNYK